MDKAVFSKVEGNQAKVRYFLMGFIGIIVVSILILPRGKSVEDKKLIQRNLEAMESKPFQLDEKALVLLPPERTSVIEPAPLSKESLAATMVADQERQARFAAPMTILKKSDKETKRESRVSRVRARLLEHPDYTIVQGKFIAAHLETEINSDLPGLVRAIVSEDVYADRGHRVLIPKGSRLVGQYSSEIALGQRRVMVVWNRAVHATANLDVEFKSPSTDPLGSTGQTGELDSRFFQRFGEASLMSLISAGAANIRTPEGEGTKSYYRDGLVDSFAETASATLEKQQQVPPTITVRRGEKINVFVAEDLDFSGVFDRAL